MAFNQYPRRGRAQLTREFVTFPATGSVAPTADQAQAEILVFGSSTVSATTNLPGGITMTGAVTVQLPVTVRTGADIINGDDGQWWWLDFTAITYSGQTITVAGTKADGTASTGITYTSGAMKCCYWNGSDIVKFI